MTKALEKKVRELLDNCPLGFYGGKVCASRETTEHDIVIWLTKLYEIKDDMRTESGR